MEFTFTVSEKEVQEKWAEQVSVDNWIEMYTKLSESYSSWILDLQLAEFIIKRVKEGYIDKYRDEDIPEVLRPLLLGAISDNIKKENEKNKDITFEDVGGVNELKAIEKLRDYKSLDYEDGINLFCDGYDLAMEEKGETTFDLSEVDVQDLIKEIQNRV